MAAVMGVASRLGSAQVRWNDYVGTAAADDADALLNTRSLYEIAGLDRDRWRIVGIDFSTGFPAEQVVVYALDRASEASTSAAVDALSVTAFDLGASVQLDQFLREAFGRISVRLLSAAVNGNQIDVVAEHSRPAGD
jgi:hypothetical protein